MRKVLTFGITQKQQQIITAAVSNQYEVVDTTACFTDLIAIPAEAVILCPSKLSSDSIEIFHEIFGEEHDTRIIFTEEPMFHANIMYTLEHDPNTMRDTIKTLQDRYELPAQIREAVQYREDTLHKIQEIFEPDSALSMRDKVAQIYHCCTPYTYLNQIVTHIPHLKFREKVPYRYELNHILLAVMLAHGLVEKEHLLADFCADDAESKTPFLSHDIQWICSLSALIRDHYGKVLQKNLAHRSD